ncbi:unnamed protein product [Brassica rapa subsp. narinosa]
MKTAVGITMISFLLVAVTSSVVVSGVNEFVLDYQGKPVKPGTLYYVHHWHQKRDSWLYPGSFRTSCPDTLAVVPTSYSLGERVQIMFNMVREDIGGVRVSTELNIWMPLGKTCSKSGYWRFAFNSWTREYELVPTGSRSSSDSIFTIQKSDRRYPSYEFVFGSENSTVIRFLELPSAPAFVSGKESAFSFYPV